ncbi:unnamed protein product, partial [Rotaria magnacalcarata]
LVNELLQQQVNYNLELN